MFIAFIDKKKINKNFRGCCMKKKKTPPDQQKNTISMYVNRSQPFLIFEMEINGLHFRRPNPIVDINPNPNKAFGSAASSPDLIERRRSSAMDLILRRRRSCSSRSLVSILLLFFLVASILESSAEVLTLTAESFNDKVNEKL